MSQTHIVALGSSFAAGPDIEPIIDTDAKRSGNNYAHQLATKLNAKLTDLTVSGATLINVLNEPQQAFRGTHMFPPQLDSLPADAHVVTLTGGGNDMGYFADMFHDSLMSYTGPLKGLFSSWWPNPAPPISQEELTNHFLNVIDKIKSTAPKATIYLVEYLTIVGDGTTPGKDVPLTPEQIAHYKDRAAFLDGAYQRAAEARPGVEVIHAGHLSIGHEVGTAEPWMRVGVLGCWLRGMCLIIRTWRVILRWRRCCISGYRDGRRGGDIACSLLGGSFAVKRWPG